MLFIDARQAESLLDLGELMDALEKALMEFSAGRVEQPVRSAVRVREHAGWFGLMPAVYGEVFGAKLVTVFPGNATRGLQTHLATIQLFRSETGEPIAMLDGRVITAWRTAAVSALAARELSPPDASVLAILGSGVQARSHFRALSTVRRFSEIRVWSRSPEHAARFAGEIGAVATSAEQAVRGADIVVTVTNTSEPVLEATWLKQGVFVNAVGAVGPDARELQDDVLRGAAVIVESRESAARESGEIIHSGAPIYAELGELLARSRPAPQSRTIVYKSLGIAVEDIAAAFLIYKKALASADRIKL